MTAEKAGQRGLLGQVQKVGGRRASVACGVRCRRWVASGTTALACHASQVAGLPPYVGRDSSRVRLISSLEASLEAREAGVKQCFLNACA